jgi:hypothetical protein
MMPFLIAALFIMIEADLYYSVAPIIYQCSDVVLSVQPTLAEETEFSFQIANLLDRKTTSLIARGIPEVRNKTLQ